MEGAAELSAQINDLKAKAETEVDKGAKRQLDAKIKELDRELQQKLNIATFGVDKATGAAKEIYNPLSGNTGSGIANPAHASRALENDIFGVISGSNKRDGILSGRKVFNAGNKEVFAKLAAQFPAVAAFINGAIGRKGGKKADAIPGINPIDVTTMPPEEADAALGKIKKELPAFSKAVQEKFPHKSAAGTEEEPLAVEPEPEVAPEPEAKPKAVKKPAVKKAAKPAQEPELDERALYEALKRILKTR
jgi:hypothetical protein